MRYWAISLVELLSMGLLMYNMLVERLFGNGFTTIILFAVLFLCLVSSGEDGDALVKLETVGVYRTMVL